MGEKLPVEFRFSRRERQIMEIVYQFGNATVAQVRESMDDSPSRNTVRTLLGILERKGYLRHRQSGRTYVYYPSRPHSVAGRSAVVRVLKTFFGGSLEQALVVYLAPPNEEISNEELLRIEALIQKARSKGKKHE